MRSSQHSGRIHAAYAALMEKEVLPTRMNESMECQHTLNASTIGQY